jgi:hypothetical protein
MRWFERTTLVLCVATSFALVACGGDDDDSTGGNGSKPAKPGGMFGNPDVTAGHTTGGSGKSGSSGAAGASSGCGDGLARTSRLTPRVIFVLDGSCSMSTNYPANGGQSATECVENPTGRWAALRNALVAPGTGVISQLQGQVEFGLAVFGTQRRCPIPGEPIESALNNLNAIEAALPQVQPGQFTPTGAALDWVYDNMFSGDQLDSDRGAQILILATDGEPNSCDNADTNYQPSIDALNKSRDLGVRTYVISLADAAGPFHDHLQQLADIGVGTTGAPLYEPTTPDALRDALQELVGGAVGCDISLNGLVDDSKKCEGTVTLNGNALKCDDPNGYSVPDARHIRIQGDACELLKSSPNAELDASFPCGVFAVD